MRSPKYFALYSSHFAFRSSHSAQRGSYFENRPDSDLDLLINLNTTISLFQLVRMERKLSELLGVKVDLVSEGALKNQKLRKYIEADSKIIFQS